MPYFDHNATTPMCEPARRAWLEMESKHWHNPSSLYREAAEARRELESRRERLAELLGDCDPEGIIFTSGATEANNALFRTAGEWRSDHPGMRVLISAHEHPSVREPAMKFCRAIEANESTIDAEARAGNVALVSWMMANNETGMIYNWQALAHRALAAGFDFHSDAAQSIGKMPLDGIGAESPMLTGSAHKFGGPRGVGFLRLSPRAAEAASRFQLGGPQEGGRRAGTENLPGVAAMLAALEWAQSHLPGDAAPRDEFENRIAWPVVGFDRPRLWNTSLVIAPRHDNRLWLARLSQRGFQCSTGSACSSGKDGDSHVLAAMGLAPGEMKRVLRFSSGWTTTADDWRALAAALDGVLAELDARAVRPKAHR
jgi:cysteine desulfurase